jgi:radical SAM superfamily enzyme YgiQ (UPF0313 family)
MNILLTTRREKAEQRNPIALLDLATYLRGFGHYVDCYYLDQLANQNGKTKSYDLVGVSVLQVLRDEVPLKDSVYLKKKFGTHTVVGGKWVQTLTQAQRDRFGNEGIEIYAGQGEKYFEGREIQFDSYPSWDRRDFETLQDVRAEVMSTRGCPYHCHFCHNTEKRLSFFSPRRTADNIQLLFDHQVKRVFICDDIFTLKASHMAALYEEMKRRNIPFEHRMEFFTHVNHLQGDILEWIKRFKPYQVNVGVESGDDRMLQAMGKGFDSRMAYERLKLLYEYIGVRIGTLFLIGFPGETEESLRNTLHFIERIRPFAGTWVSYYQPVPGTIGYEMAWERTKEVRQGRRNMSITYVDPNLSWRILFKYNYRMMDYSSPNHLRKKLIYRFIDFAPPFLLETWRTIRQRKRLKRYLDGYLEGLAA